MPAITAKEMLARIIQARTLTPGQQEIFEGMWDAVHRYGRLSTKQVGWIETVFYKQPKKIRKGHVDSTSVTSPHVVTTMQQFRSVCLDCSAEQAERVEQFFRSGGQQVEIRPI